ncbi:flavin reductase family protein [Pacificimonas sp. ICDLI1SI03]|tara:strand:- start:179203 stop:179745 length:543 start_codon:yes stop_codon:yes gene_type:complete
MATTIENFADLPLPEQMRMGLRRLGKAVAVITAWHGEKRWAMTATAVSELSMDPPSLLVCVNRNASLYEPLSLRSNFCVNILHSDQANISQACFGDNKGEARFRLGHWDSAACGTPLLREGQANFVCEYQDILEYGTHAIIIGRVDEVRICGDVDPLIYLDGCYTRACPLAPEGTAAQGE